MSLPRFLMDHFYFKKFCKPPSKEHSCKITMEFERGPPKEHPVNPVNSF